MNKLNKSLRNANKVNLPNMTSEEAIRDADID